MTTWHAHPDDLAAYVAGDDDPVLAASVETHLLRCADCRTALARATRTAPGGEDTDSDALGQPRRRRRHPPVGAARPPRRVHPAAARRLAAGRAAGAPGAGRAPRSSPARGLPTLLLALAPIAPSLAVVLAYRDQQRPRG